jgi:hypothetical protein
LEFTINDTGEVRQLSVGDDVIPNLALSSTRYRIIEVSTSESNPRIRLERIEGLQPIPVGIGTLKIYSPVVYRKKVRISIGYNERNVIFIKPLNADNNLLSRNWSGGTGFYTNDLIAENGTTMDQFYTDFVYDYGEVLQEMVAKKIPTTLGIQPNIPLLDVDNFKVVQINKHLTDSVDSDLLKDKNNYQKSLQSEISQLSDAIEDRNKKLKITRFTSDSSKKQYELEISDLVEKKNSKSKLLATTIQEILDLSKQPISNIEPKFKIRGFWKMPDPVIKRGTDPQEVVQFRIEYKYLSKDGKENQIDTIKENDITMLNWWFMNDFGILPKYELKTLKQIIAEYVCCNEIFLKIYNNINLQYTKYDLIKLITNEKFEILHFLFCKNFYIFQNFFVVKTLIISNNIDFIKQLQSRFDIRIYIDSILNDMYLYKFISLEMLKYLNTLKNIKINTSYLSYNSRIDILNWFDKIHNRNINKTELEEFIFYAVCSSDRQLLNWLYINSLKKPLKYKIYITQRVFNLINNNLRMYEWFSHRNLI